MKTQIFIFISVLFSLSFLFTINQSHAQSAVNMNWKLSLGEPDSLGWCSSVVDNYGNTYLTGNTQVPNEGTNLYVSKCDKHGNLIWDYEFNHSFNGNDYGVGITTDSDYNVYIIGTSKTSVQNDLDFTLIKLNSAGSFEWVQHYNGTGSSEDIGLVIALDANNNIGEF